LHSEDEGFMLRDHRHAVGSGQSQWA